MVQQIADRRDVDFVLHEQLQIADLSKHEQYAEFNKKTVDLVVSEARNLAIKEILPTSKIGDDEGVTLESGKITVPEVYHKAYSLLQKGEWFAMAEDLECGGQGMPHVLEVAALDYLNGANFALLMYAGLTHGAGKLVEAFGTEKQKKLFLKKLFSGEWTGTMLLTEPEAGSDVGALTTTATKNDDGTYSISGSKIFISGGEHDMTENIVHPVLARIEGAPPGTKGISLFLVPKFRVDDDGNLGEFNDVVCTGIEEKLGIHGSSTCTLTLGGKEGCIGTLLGEENKGMSAMFLMMNAARLLVGLQGFTCASAAYMYAVNYARQRIQGRNLLKMREKDAESVPIIQHPDVRRQLLMMKAYVEGMRSLLYYVGFCEDKAIITDDEKEKDKYRGMIDLLVPIAKGYVTDKAFEICSHGMQVYGGYGYIKEYPMEQLLRDCRITMLYEGTNGIQAMDFLGRKLGLQKGQLFMNLLGEMHKTIAAAKNIPELADNAEKVEAAVNKLGEAAIHIGMKAMSEEVLTAFAFAHPFMEITGDMVIAWMLLWRAATASANMKKNEKDAAFYEGQIKSSEFFTHSILPITMGKMDAVLTTNSAVVEISEDAFGGK